MNLSHRTWIAAACAVAGLTISVARADSVVSVTYTPPCYSAGSSGLPSDLEFPFLRIRSDLAFRNLHASLSQIASLEQAIRFRMGSGYQYPTPPYYGDPMGCFGYGRTGIRGYQEDLYLRIRTELLNHDYGNALHFVWSLAAEVRQDIARSTPHYPAPPVYSPPRRHPAPPYYPAPRHPTPPVYSPPRRHPAPPRYPTPPHRGRPDHGHRDDHRRGGGRDDHRRDDHRRDDRRDDDHRRGGGRGGRR